MVAKIPYLFSAILRYAVKLQCLYFKLIYQAFAHIFGIFGINFKHNFFSLLHLHTENLKLNMQLQI